MEAEEIKTKPHKQLVVHQYSTGNTKEQHKEATRLLALPNLELEAIDCNHRVVVWNLVEHWQWENVYEVVPAAAGMELSWIILDHISSFKNYINLAGSVVLNAFEKALNYYTLGQNPLFQITCGKKTVTNYNALAEHLKTLEGHAAPKPTTLQNLIKELNHLVPEG
ncbi:uncharacterized protein ACA1_243140, partial [Acanthamoeba castellanii str. Neff]